MQIHRDDGKLSVNHSPRFDFSNRITEIKNFKNQQFLPFLPLLFSSNRDHTNWVKALTSQAGLTNCMKCIWDQNMKWITQQGRREEFLFHLLSPPQAQLSSAQLPAPQSPTYLDLRHLTELQMTRTGPCSRQPLPVWGWLWRESVCWLWREVKTSEPALILSLSQLSELRAHSPSITSWKLFLLLSEDKHKILFFLWTGLIPLAPAGKGTEQVEFSGVMSGFMHLCGKKGFLNPVPLTCKDKSYWGCLLLPDWQDPEIFQILLLFSFFIPAT